MSQFFLISIRFASDDMLGTNLSSSGVRRVYLCDAVWISISLFLRVLSFCGGTYWEYIIH